ncbi:MAG TPA: DUF2742 domain-containing protein [Gordonia sp. (in: high G+C Gram-positive bacteria)]|uniref:DUF2742 domain-containing protein n=1 Tax=unclassified Gordonia (in: high G+C Gram-positive bacteria) TaxID=2657482 RepID=UPI0025B870AA|nr:MULTISPECIES: DUF2742 domain-containing protein [unclassified Gordonia (in: high G+C Gram-positive bacteria)]HNP57515.1 DUF2742 domain-containing protein [Gordonia sp. (in: high G+C Gram-positive bacteria)]HRC51100.1 DUF2742 domain-containing protein [Gordonia sp. (in: high G+C Gram-positive bacteria)]
MSQPAYATALDGLLGTLERLERHGTPPVLGTPTWRELPDGHPLRAAAILRAALLWCFEHDLADDHTERMKTAALDVVDGTDWAAAANSIRRRDEAIKSGARIERRSA